MIQVSSHVYTGTEEAKAPEHSAESSSRAGEIKSKKEKKGGALGVFAKILAGLTAANTKTIQTGQTETGEAKDPALKAENLRRKPEKTGFGSEKAEAGTAAEKKKSALTRPSAGEDSGEDSGKEMFPAELLLPGERPGENKTESFRELSAEISLEEAEGGIKAAGSGESGPLQNRKTGNRPEFEGDPRIKAVDADPASVLLQGTMAEFDSIPKPGGKKLDSSRARTREDAGDPEGIARRARGPELFRFSGESKTGLVDIIGRDKTGSGRTAESRDKRQGKAAVKVQDLRSPDEKTNAGPAGASQNPVKAGDDSSGIPFEFRGDGMQPASRETASAGEAASGWEGRSAQSLSEFLARELHQNLNGDIVRQAHLALRDGNTGSLRLSLKPESLGNVKIRLEMSENKITGRIIVESEEAFRAFTQEIHALEEAFRESGYDAANLEMSLAGNGAGEAGGEGQGEEASSPFHAQAAALRYESAGENRINSAGSVIWQDMQVNVLV
ncbi:MAG: flagellar hook-length control protein FliK [Treponema sp.]|nr:flagellar hook-length control protein FliK [Treponema sp.]